MGLLFSGIDEAGYGPMLGPLCVGCASITIENWDPSTRAPDLWTLLSDHVARSRKDANGRFVYADSKALKGANSSVRTHPLAHLERGVLAMLGTRGPIPETDTDLYALLGVETGREPWFGGEPIRLPVGNDIGLLKIDTAGLRSAMASKGIALGSIRVGSMGVGRFNALVREHGTKAATTSMMLVEHLSRVRSTPNVAHTRVAIDRQSGRTHYARLLSRVWNSIETLEESPRASRYGIGDELGIVLISKAEDAYFPVALASMSAKYVRELMMMRFNRYFASRDASLKPTAGYVQDARRWLRDASALIEGVDRAILVRDA